MVVLDWLNKLAHFIPTVDILSQRLSNICWLKLHGGFIPLIEPTAVPPLGHLSVCFPQTLHWIKMGMSQVSSFNLNNLSALATNAFCHPQPLCFPEFISQQCLNVHFCLQTEIPFNQLYLWNPFSETKGMISVLVGCTQEHCPYTAMASSMFWKSVRTYMQNARLPASIIVYWRVSLFADF